MPKRFNVFRVLPLPVPICAAIVPARHSIHLFSRACDLAENSAPQLPSEIAAASEKLVRGMGLLQSTAVNMLNMIGIGPFITIGVILSAMGGPQAVLGWLLGAFFSVCDGMVYAELGAAMPGAGGAFIYFREAFDARTWGHLFSFLFLWETIFVAPLGISAAAVGFAEYCRYFFPHLGQAGVGAVAASVCVFITFLLYRPVKSVGRYSVVMLGVVLLAILWVVLSGLIHIDTKMAFDFPPGAFHLSKSFFYGLAGATLDRDVQLRRLQQHHLPRRRGQKSIEEYPSRHRALRAGRRGSLCFDERSHHRSRFPGTTRRCLTRWFPNLLASFMALGRRP